MIYEDVLELDGKPCFDKCYSFNFPQYRSDIEAGSYIKFSVSDKVCYGRIINVYLSPSSHVHTLRVNQFVKLSTLMEMGECSHAAIINPYVDIDELVQTSYVMDVLIEMVKGIIFVFKKDPIVNGVYPCEGMEHVFLLRVRYMNGQFEDIDDTQCLPFPCEYDECPLCISYSKRIYNALYGIRKRITHVMCRNSEKLGRSFIQGRDLYQFDIQAWVFIVRYCEDSGVPIYGPFSQARKHLQMRKGLELNGVRRKGEIRTVRFESRHQFHTFDNIFGTYVRNGLYQKRPAVNE